MKRIVTVTLNPAVDRTLWVDRLEPGRTHRADETQVSIGGKGINVARTAARCGVEVTAAGLAGENQLVDITRELASHGVRARFLPLPGDTRTNIKIVDRSANRMTEINERGRPVEAKTVERFETELLDLCASPEVGVVVLAGSLPPGVPAGIYARWTERLNGLARAKGRPLAVIVDASGEALEAALAAAPFLIKPNREEAQRLLGRPIPGAAEAEAAARELVNRGPRGVLLSLGAEGAVAAWEGETARFAAKPLEAPTGSFLTPVGAGDAMVGRIAASLAERGDLALSAEEFFSLCRDAVEEAAAHITRQAGSRENFE